MDVTSPYASYLWQDGSTSPFYIIKEAGIYSVTVSNACMSVSEAIEITTKDCNCNLWLPNIFTPYSNGISYVYLPVTTSEFYSFSMTIYNRWGMEVFRTNKFIGWDGKIKDGDKVLLNYDPETDEITVGNE